MKKLLALVLCLLLTVQILPVGFFTFEASAATSGDYTYTVSGGKATITAVSTSISGVVTIPSTLGGYPVTSIGYEAFRNCSGLTSVTIPDSVTSIGDEAFYGCESLTGITIPDSVTSIGDYTFENCSSLTGITIPDSVTSIGNGAFYNCSSLTGITIPDSVTSIGWSAFYNCDSLTSITIPDSVKSIGEHAFRNCSSLTSVTIPDSVTSIGDSVFGGCSSLTDITVDENNSAYCSVDGVLFSKDQTTLLQYPGGKSGAYIIPDSVTSIGNGAFYGCSSLTSITIPDSVTSIGKYAFHECSRLTSITIPDSVTSIGWSAFHNCSSLTGITIPDSVTSIGSGAFEGCDNLTSVTIPDSVTSIGGYAFEGCSSLTKVYYTGSAAQRGRISIGTNNTALANAEWHYTESHDSCEGNHYDGVCDETCNVCGATRMAHVYDNACDADCNVCGDVRTPDVHRVEGGVVTFTNATNYPFRLVDGVYQSTNKAHSSTATATLNALHSGKVTIQYYTSTEQNYDKLIIKQNGTAKDTVSGSTSWATLTLTVAAGDSITVSYTKDGSESSGNDTVYFKFSGLISAADEEPTCEDAVICSVCGVTVKQALGHRYDNDCDTACNICGGIRTVPDHLYDNACDVTCNVCDAVREVGDHLYDNDCDTDCNECGSIRTVGDHLYDNDCDTACNECGKERTVPDHNYEWIVDEQATCGVNGSKHEQCSICNAIRSEGTVIPATGEHTYDNACDAVCNECGQKRTIVHNFSLSGGHSCSVCGYSKQPDAPTVLEKTDTTVTLQPTEGFEYGVMSESCTGRWLDGSYFIDALVVDGTEIVPDAEGHGFTIVMSTGVSHSGYAGALEIADNDEQYRYLVLEVDAVNNKGWNIAGLTGQASGFLTTGGRYVVDLSTTYYGFCDILWMSGYTDGTMGIHVKEMYLTNDFYTVPSDIYWQDSNVFEGLDPATVYTFYQRVKQGEGIAQSDISDGASVSTHSYTSDCDTTCNVCSEGRTAPQQHTHDNDCDTTCNVCGDVRTVGEHLYDSDCDLFCNTCRAQRIAPQPHTYDNACDTTCNACEWTRTVEPHDFSLNSGHTCAVCGKSNRPAAPGVALLGTSSVRLVIYAGFEYSKDGVVWQDSPVFDGLLPSTAYTFYQRVKASASAQQSAVSAGTTVITAAGQAACTHRYDDDDDTTCNECGEVREVVDDSAATLTVQGATVMAGKQVQLQVLLAGNPGFTYLELTPTYPADWVLEAQNGALVAELTQGKQLVWASDENMTDDGLLVTLVFTVPQGTAVGEYDIGFTVRGCYNYDEQALALRVVSGTVTVIDFIYGDANGDGVIDGRDVTRLTKYLANYDYDTETSSIEIGKGADANGDGTIDGRDVTRLKKYLANYDYDTESSTVVLGPSR